MCLSSSISIYIIYSIWLNSTGPGVGSSISTIAHSGCARSSDSVSPLSPTVPQPPSRGPRSGARALRPSSLILFFSRSTFVTVLLTRKASARACRVGTRQRPTWKTKLWWTVSAFHCSCAELLAWSTGSSRRWHNWHRTPQINSVSQLRPLPPLVCPTGAFTFSSQILRFDRSTSVRIWLRRNWSARSWDTWKAMRPGRGALLWWRWKLRQKKQKTHSCHQMETEQ